MTTRVINVRAKGQMTLPADIREELGLQDGGVIYLERRGKEFVLTPADAIEDPTAGIFKEFAYTHNPDIEEEKVWIARHIAETADTYEK
ncbi:MAG TPA: AbrB/MazE/SpoVT family DNA-binding domain-containing protein [Thermomicrobiales bacterium]|nr:AbrB/MazE/SpoVT family DNA-binding domain-containing protein [Thermomicrobiales bacterium]